MTELTINKKYYVICKLPEYMNKNIYLQLHILIHDIHINTQIIGCDYITISTTKNSKDIIDECGYNKLTLPLSCIQEAQDLHNILDTLFIDDIIYVINSYI